MRLQDQLERWKQRGQINQPIIEVVLHLRERLATYWRADVARPQVELLLFHIACSLGRIERGGCASPLYQEMFEEVKSAVHFPFVFAIHQDLLSFMPFPIPAAEQTYFLANLHSLMLEQAENLNKNVRTLGATDNSNAK